MKSKTLKTLVLTLVMASMLLTSVSAATIGGGEVNATVLNLRSQPSTSAKIVAKIPNREFVLVESKTGDWYKVVYDGTEGYVHSDYVIFQEYLIGDYSYNATVNGSGVRLRNGASTYSDIIANYNVGAKLSVVGVSGNWLKVVTGTGQTGFMSSDYIKYSTAQKAAISQALTVGEQLVNTAKQYLGIKYVWGGMSTSGFDCSGFVNYVYKQHGYSMYRVAQDIYNNDGTWVSKDSLRVGDLVFFGYSASSINHVGMYIGNGQFIHASSGAGQVVITDLDTNYYTRMYVGAKRIIG